MIRARPGDLTEMSEKNRGLITDAQGEFVQQFPGGAFDPRTFRHGSGRRGPAGPSAVGEGGAADRPPVDDERMSGPGEEIDKAR